MAILKKNQVIWLGKSAESRIYYDVRYQGPGYNKTEFFAAIPQDQGANKGIAGIEWIEGSKGKNNGAYGFKATTQQEAIDKLTKAMTDDYNSGVKKEKFIFIDNDNESKTKYHGHNGDENTKRTVTFSYKLVVKVTRKETVKYFQLNSAGFETSFEMREHGYSAVPWTEEREANCKLILDLFDRLQDRVNSLITSDPVGMLDKNVALLLQPAK
jgi:hypothetical protein